MPGRICRRCPGPGLVPLWTTRRASLALSVELSVHDFEALAVAVQPAGRVASTTVRCGTGRTQCRPD
jgi:hypothetical protein